MRMRIIGVAVALAWLGWTSPAQAAWSPAKFEGKQAGLCAEGQFFDLIDHGTCWTCPEGYARTFFSVKSDRACEKASATEFHHAVEHAKGTGLLGTDCPAGQFWDIVDGKCHSCPPGYGMQILEHVHSEKKCAKDTSTFSRATKIGPPCGEGRFWDPRQGGECWSCPQGFVRTIFPVTSDQACESRR